MSKIKNSEFEALPKYVKLNDSVLALRRNGNGGYKLHYYIDNGGWGVKFEYVDGVMKSIHSHVDSVNNIELIPSSYTAYIRAGNKSGAITWSEYIGGGSAFASGDWD